MLPTKRQVSAALRAAGFAPASFNTGIALVPCESRTCVEWVWRDGLQVSIPAGAHKHRAIVGERSHKAGFRLIESGAGVIVRGIDPLTVREALTKRGFDVQLNEQYAWRAFSQSVRYDSALVVGRGGAK